MLHFSAAIAVYLVVVLTLAAVATGAALGTATAVIVHNRRIRLASHLSLRAYYAPRLTLHS
jgi:hypothetical protein